MIELYDEALYIADFKDVWFVNCDARYRALKGGRSTGKTYNFNGLEPIFKILADSRRNIMMVRQNYKDNSSSTYPQLKSIIYKLGIAHLFRFYTSPLKIVRKDTGQVILFGGMNDVENLTSTSVEFGYWTDIYFEEASQLKSYDEFRIVDGSLRLPNYESDLKAQITFCFNAWDVGHWLYDVFFKGNMEDDINELERKGYQFKYIPEFNLGADGKGLALHTSSYKCNPYLSEDKLDNVRQLKQVGYDFWLVEAMGCWGNTADKTYTHFEDRHIHPATEIDKIYFDNITIGIDTGLSNGEGKISYGVDNSKRLGSAMTMCLCGVCDNWNKMVAIDEYYDTNIGRTNTERKTEPQYVEEMCLKIKDWLNAYNLWDIQIFAYVDCADVGFRDNMELCAVKYGLDNVVFIGSTKIPILTRVRFSNLMFMWGDVLISDNCKNLIRELRNARKDKTGKCREDFDDHEINAWEYGWIPIKSRLSRWKVFKE